MRALKHLPSGLLWRWGLVGGVCAHACIHADVYMWGSSTCVYLRVHMCGMHQYLCIFECVFVCLYVCCVCGELCVCVCVYMRCVYVHACACVFVCVAGLAQGRSAGPWNWTPPTWSALPPEKPHAFTVHRLVFLPRQAGARVDPDPKTGLQRGKQGRGKGLEVEAGGGGGAAESLGLFTRPLHPDSKEAGAPRLISAALSAHEGTHLLCGSTLGVKSNQAAVHVHGEYRRCWAP